MTPGSSAGSALTALTTAIRFTATASRARDPQFDSAVIGNSTAQMLDPAELSRATGLRFVQLYLTGRISPRATRGAGFLPAAIIGTWARW